MQIFRTSRAQTAEPQNAQNDLLTDPGRAETVDQELESRVEDFFADETGPEQPVVPESPFDILFLGASPASESDAVFGSPSVTQFAPANVVTLEEWLMTHPEGIHKIHLYKEKMEHILENRFVRRLNSLKEALQGGGMTPRQVIVVQEVIEQIEEAIIKIQQEIEKAGNKMAELQQVYHRERSEMRDLNNDGIIGDKNSDDYYIVALHPVTHEQVILDKNRNPTPYVFMNPDYTPALVSEENLKLIPADQMAGLPRGSGDFGFDVAFELNNVHRWLEGGFTDSTFGAQLDFAVPEGVWVEADENGKPKEVWDERDSNHKFNPRSFELIEREDGKKMWGQKPPSDEEREDWVFVRVASVEVQNEDVGRISGEEVDGGYVHILFKDREDKTALRIRVQGVETTSVTPLNSDGTHTIAASSVGLAFNGGRSDENQIMQNHSRITPVEIDASLYHSTGKILPANMYDSPGAFYEELGIPNATHQIESENHEDNISQAHAAANDTMVHGFLHPFAYMEDPVALADARGLEGEARAEFIAENKNVFLDAAHRFGLSASDERIEFLEEVQITSDRTLSTMAAYLPTDPSGVKRYDRLKTGVFIKDLRGNITGSNYNDIILVPPPDEEELLEFFPPGTEHIANNHAAWGTTVDANGGKNIVVSKGGDIYVKDATFFWREAAPGARGDMVYVDVSKVNSADNNNKIFIHIGDQAPDVVAIRNGEDLDPNDVDSERTKNLNRSDGDQVDPRREFPAAQDDWFDAPEVAEFSDLQNELPGGLSTTKVVPGLGQDVDTIFNDTAGKIDSEVIRLDPLDPELYADIEWELPALVTDEDENWDAFFNEWEFFMDQDQAGDLDNLEETSNE